MKKMIIEQERNVKGTERREVRSSREQVLLTPTYTLVVSSEPVAGCLNPFSVLASELDL